ncbi:Threonine dehydratase [Rubidibacter lacunae KORDI 51-2]|uniref:threonine ammonia-lyase n=1 Tax=Rubidibacter lacunae KORDI 51-2 TaxID=582515 RepID=U5DMR2_9CHRO|nr:pyridoxal-phosphate dependent enzyme [Rubidibacter lacunae]ERN42122.1 Threonine dehydratase [Rubidibacter lacunae KORDI 51-2]
MIDQILTAARRLSEKARITPTVRSIALNEALGADVVFKCENYQKIGAFKYRGAYNAISQLSREKLSRGMVTYSSGNHAQAVARVGKELGTQTVIVMPIYASSKKRRATEKYGAEVILHDPKQVTCKQVANDLQKQFGYVMIPPYDHPQVIAGQGTAALEFLSQTPLDSLLVPCGGGGLLSGSAIAAKHLNPKCRVIGIEPVLADDATRSFHSRTLQRVKSPATIADGTRAESLGSLTFPLILDYVDDMRTVSEQAIVEAVSFFFHEMKLVVEPSGALGLAALLDGAIEANGMVGVIVSGGNVDEHTLNHILSSAKRDFVHQH